MAYDYLSDLNGEQRRAVKHGVKDGSALGSLLVIAGAGTGKTKTLANRVAHLIVNGVDAHRILLLTFSRRAATSSVKIRDVTLGQPSRLNLVMLIPAGARIEPHLPTECPGRRENGRR